MTPDWLLLRRYAREDSQEAFAALTARYLNLVYSVCLREVHDPEQAQEVAQAVFLLLARTAPSFRSKTALPGWLFRTARFAAQNARTREQRRRHYEGKAALAMQQEREGAENAAWSEIEPVLNDALAALRERDRECVLLRFFQGLSFSEAGAALGLSEEAARKRVGRALEKMRAFFGKEGVIVPVAVLAVLLPAHSVRAAPTGFVVGQGGTNLVAPQVSRLMEGVLHAMKVAKFKALMLTTVLLITGAGGISFLGMSLAAKPAHTPGLTRRVRPVPPTKTLNPLAGQPVSIDRQARKLLDRMAATYQGLSSYSGETTFLVANGAGGVQALKRHELQPQVKASIIIERPRRVAVRVKGESNYVFGGKGVTETTAVSDGSDYYETRPSPPQAENHYLHSPSPADALTQALGTGGMLAAQGHLAGLLNGQKPVLGVHTLKMGPQAVSDGVPVVTVVAVSQVNDKMIVNGTHIPSQTTETFLIGARDHLLRRWTVSSRFVDPHLVATIATATRPTHGVFWMQIEDYQNVRANPKLPARAFTFIRPIGSKEMKIVL